jgi:hypothetical protein
VGYDGIFPCRDFVAKIRENSANNGKSGRPDQLQEALRTAQVLLFLAAVKLKLGSSFSLFSAE